MHNYVDNIVIVTVTMMFPNTQSSSFGAQT